MFVAKHETMRVSITSTGKQSVQESIRWLADEPNDMMESIEVINVADGQLVNLMLNKAFIVIFGRSLFRPATPF